MTATWQPIETAPKDGTRILVYFGSMGVWQVAAIDRYDDGDPMWCVDDNKMEPYALRGWSDDEDSDTAPTHWCPLPEPPKENA